MNNIERVVDIYFIWAGQTPIMLAEDDEQMTLFLENHLQDIQSMEPDKHPWRFEGAWHIHGKC